MVKYLYKNNLQNKKVNKRQKILALRISEKTKDKFLKMIVNKNTNI